MTTPTHPEPLSCVCLCLVGQRHGQTPPPLSPPRGSPTCHGSSTGGLLPTGFLAGGTRPLCHPGTPATLRASCRAFCHPQRGLQGGILQRGTGEPGGPGRLSIPTQPPEAGFPGKGTGIRILGSWGEAVPHWGAPVGDQAPVLRIKRGAGGSPWHPSPMCPFPDALRGHDQCTMEPRKGELRGRTPHFGGGGRL